MSRPEEYLAIPEGYGRWLGGLRWSADREAVEYAADRRVGGVAIRNDAINLTFAMAVQVARFLEGFHAVRSPVPFPYILHLLKLLNPKNLPTDPRLSADDDSAFARLSHHYRTLGMPLGNAGALCGMLCRDVPRATDPPDLVHLGVALRGRFPGDRPEAPVAEEASLEPKEFRERVARALRPLDDGAIVHWLQHGRGPVVDAGEAVADEAEARPLTLIETIEAVAGRPRLAGARAMVGPLEGALVLPARRLAPAGLPVGGYSDVTTRGNPEQILPSQFALDDLEFLRRFAGRELLYYHREEPRPAEEGGLVLLVDQGVRTWGDVRLALSAATLAMARRSARRGVELSIATTGNGGRPEPAGSLAEADLGALLEASDLTPDPGPALGRVLEDRPDRPRDVVLLTHPRSLAAAGVASAARRAGPGTRLFAVSVDGEGRVELSEVRRGVPIALGRCRVSVADATLPTIPEAARPAPAPDAPTPWRGDVEPCGFPFRLGIVRPIGQGRYAFDYAGQWLIAATDGPIALLHAWKLDGTRAELVPRPMVDGGPLREVEAVIGVADGFVVAARHGGDLVVAHYDLSRRACVVHRLGPLTPPGPPIEWCYHRTLHSIAVRAGDPTVVPYAVDLGADPALACYRRPEPDAPVAKRARMAAMRAPSLIESPLDLFPAGAPIPPSCYGVRLDPKTGAIDARTEAGPWETFTPLSDGQPMLKGGRVVQARAARAVLAMIVERADRQRSIQFYNGTGGHSLGGHPVGPKEDGFVIEADGRLVARRPGASLLQVRRVGSAGPALLDATRGKFHNKLSARLGRDGLLLRVGNHSHLIRWAGGRLTTAYTEDHSRADGWSSGLGGEDASALPPDRAGLYDRHRFVAAWMVGRLTVAVDAIGHVILLDDRMAPVAMAFMFRRDLAIWLPDGTMLGPPALLGGPPTPDAERRIGEALRAAIGAAEGPSS